MKLRNDFVSNSSSSSFIVATKDEFNLMEKLTNFANDLVCEIKKHIVEMNKLRKERGWTEWREFSEKEERELVESILKLGKLRFKGYITGEIHPPNLSYDDYYSVVENEFGVISHAFDLEKSHRALDSMLTWYFKEENVNKYKQLCFETKQCKTDEEWKQRLEYRHKMDEDFVEYWRDILKECENYLRKDNKIICFKVDYEGFISSLPIYTNCWIPHLREIVERHFSLIYHAENC